MTFPFLQKSHAYAARLLHAAGLNAAQIPQAVQVARETVENWLNREIEKGNPQQALRVLKGQIHEKGPKLLFEELKELVLVRLMIHLGLKSNLAASIAALLLPFVLKRVSELARKNPTLQNWWQDQNWRQHIPNASDIKTKLREVKQNITQSQPARDRALFI
jgi:hypothetical protein